MVSGNLIFYLIYIRFLQDILYFSHSFLFSSVNTCFICLFFKKWSLKNSNNASYWTFEMWTFKLQLNGFDIWKYFFTGKKTLSFIFSWKKLFSGETHRLLVNNNRGSARFLGNNDWVVIINYCVGHVNLEVAFFLSNNNLFYDLYFKWEVLRNLAPFVKFKKREKHAWKSITISKVAGWCL